MSGTTGGESGESKHRLCVQDQLCDGGQNEPPLC